MVPESSSMSLCKHIVIVAASAVLAACGFQLKGDVPPPLPA